MDSITVLLIGGPSDGVFMEIESEKSVIFFWERSISGAVKKSYNKTEIDPRIFKYSDEVIESIEYGK